jgi:hypothetical protein
MVVISRQDQTLVAVAGANDFADMVMMLRAPHDHRTFVRRTWASVVKPIASKVVLRARIGGDKMLASKLSTPWNSVRRYWPK